MALNSDELFYFNRFVLWDEAWREPSGKRQTKPLVGFWMQRSGSMKLRLSDLRLRQKVCMTALCRVDALSQSSAAAEVAHLLGLGNSSESIRTAFHEGDAIDAGYNGFYLRFLQWREWVLASPKATLERALKDFGKRSGIVERRRLGGLIRQLRQDARQLALHRTWVLSAAEDSLERIRSFHKLPSGWFLFANDLWHVGSVYALAHHPEARDYFERALELWSTYGSEWPDVERDEAVSMLRAEIAKLPPDQPS